MASPHNIIPLHTRSSGQPHKLGYRDTPFGGSSAQRTDPYDVAAGEQRIWGAVILRAILDATWVDANPTGRLTERIMFLASPPIPRKTANRLRDEAVFWLTLNRSDFNHVCANAGLDPPSVRRWAEKAMRASDAEKARWATADLSLHDLREASELRA